MCGIVGYVGKKQAFPLLIDGLKQLEYRGYDSAGMAVLDGKGVKRARAVGKVRNLEERTKKGWENMMSGTGIAHTRWATHGGVTEENAHPHCDCKGVVYIAHNGIVENWKELRRELEDEGHIFTSETDTEVLAHLIEREHCGARHLALFDAVRKALNLVEGAYGIAVMSTREPDVLVAARNSSPLVLGIGEGGNMIASDGSPIIRHTKNVVYLNDGEVARVTADTFDISTLQNEITTRNPETLEWDAVEIRKGGHSHFLHKEIYEIPEAVVNAIRGRTVAEEGNVKLGGIERITEKLRNVRRIVMVACGTASYAARVGEYMLEEYAGIPVEVDIASEFRYRKPVLDQETLLVAISQSGETADTLAAVREAKEKGIMTMGIVNVVGSSIARETGVGIYNHAGPEISVAASKSFSSQLAILTLLTVFLGRQRQMSLVMGKRIIDELKAIPEKVERILKDEEHIMRIALSYAGSEHMMFLGRKYNYPVALEGAMKLKETSYIHAEGEPAGEIKHGPIAMIDESFPLFFIAPKDSVYEKTYSNIEEVRARGGPVIVVTTEGNDELERVANEVIYIPKTLEMLSPFLTVIPAYLFAYHIAAAKGVDVDKPRNLAKSVTVE